MIHPAQNWIGVATLMAAAAFLTLFSSGCCRVYHGCGIANPCPMPVWGWFRSPGKPAFVEARKYSLFAAADFAKRSPRRVLIVPTGVESGKYQAPRQFAEELAAAIRAAGLCEIVLPEQISCQMSVDRILAGQFDEWEIVSLANTWHCDAVLFVRVNDMQGFEPLQASCTAALVDADESIVLFAIDGNWDTADAEIRAGFDHYLNVVGANMAPTERVLFGRAPKWLMAYVAKQTADAWQRAIY